MMGISAEISALQPAIEHHQNFLLNAKRQKTKLNKTMVSDGR